ncbi:MAG: hypothetical protein J6S85_12770 [Methanobrevibacter sp.]|nr:hypothetical protein [Methanobrevibacter sp.]
MDNEVYKMIMQEIQHIKENQSQLYDMDRQRIETLAELKADNTNMKKDIEEVKDEIREFKDDMKSVKKDISEINTKLNNKPRFTGKDIALIIVALIGLAGTILTALAK